jgi:hypothetical protein
MAVKRLGLTRDQLAKFLTEHEQIKQFELLFATVDEIKTTGLDSATFDAGLALAGVNKLAGSQIAQDAAAEASNALAIAQAARSALSGLPDPAMAPPVAPAKRVGVGTFASLVTQIALLPNVDYPIDLDVVDIERGIWRDSVNTSRVYVADGGIFNFQFSAQLDNTSGGAHRIWLWPRISGVDVPDSASQVRIQGNNAELVAAWNWVLRLAPGEYFELVYAVSAVALQIVTFPAAGVVPAIPSVILTVTQEA